MNQALKVKDFAGEYDDAVHYEEENRACFVEDKDGYDYRIKKVEVNKTRVTITAHSKDTRLDGMTIQDVADALECAKADQPLFVVMPGSKRNYWVKRISNGCSYFYLSSRK